jgi:hypothetical protein
LAPRFQRPDTEEATVSDLTIAAGYDDTPIASPASGTDGDSQKDGKKKKNRCLSCKKKVGLTGESSFLVSDPLCLSSSLALNFFRLFFLCSPPS